MKERDRNYSELKNTVRQRPQNPARITCFDLPKIQQQNSKEQTETRREVQDWEK